MTLIYELDVDILKMYRRAKNEVSKPKLANVLEHEQDRLTHRHTQTDATERITTAAFAACNKQNPAVVSLTLAHPVLRTHGCNYYY